MQSEIVLSGIKIEVTRKRIKNLNIRVYPYDGMVKISSPHHLAQKTVEEFARSRLNWIKKHLAKQKNKPQNQLFTYTTGEPVMVWGNKFRLVVIEKNRAPFIHLDDENRLFILNIRPGADFKKRQQVVSGWYRARLRNEIPKIIRRWEGKMNVSVEEFGIKQMKTRWGTCNTRAKRIWLNLELAKKDPLCLEFIVVHEMVHLLERLHSKRFYRLMDQFLPDWRVREQILEGRL